MTSIDRPGDWVALSANYWIDPKIIAVSAETELLFVRSLAYSKASRGSGFIPKQALNVFAAGLKQPQKCAETLVEQGLWEVVDGGWIITSWGQWNPSEDELEERREMRKTAASKAANARWRKAKDAVGEGE